MAYIKTADLSGLALDWAVARTLGLYITIMKEPLRVLVGPVGRWSLFAPSTDRGQCCELVATLRLSVLPSPLDQTSWVVVNGTRGSQWATTYRLAACRGVVAGKYPLGLEVPDDLL